MENGNNQDIMPAVIADEEAINKELKVKEGLQGESFLQSMKSSVGELYAVGSEIVGDYVDEGKQLLGTFKETNERVSAQPQYIKGVPNSLIFWGGLAVAGYFVVKAIK